MGGNRRHGVRVVAARPAAGSVRRQHAPQRGRCNRDIEAHPRVDDYSQIALTLVGPLGRVGFYLFAASLGITCFGACLEQALETGYVASQAFGWNWGQSEAPAKVARFTAAYTASIILSALVLITGIDPLKLTMLSMALTAVMLPLSVTPLLVIMNDRDYLKEHTNGTLSNFVIGFIVAMTCILAVIAIPLEYFGS